MIKKITIASVVAMAIVGCGGSGSSSSSDKSSNFVTKNEKAVTVKGLRDLGSDVNLNKDSTKNIRSLETSYNDKSESDNKDSDSCSDGGYITMSGMAENSTNMSLDATNCKEGSSTINGALKIKDFSENSGSIEITKDFSITDDDIDLSIEKGSNISFSKDKLSIDFKSVINSQIVAADNIIVGLTGVDEDSGTISIKSGSMNIADYYFEVVSQDSPFAFDKNGDLTSGLLKLKDGADHKIELEGKNNKLSLKVDQNGNGTFEPEETLSEDITTEDFSF